MITKVKWRIFAGTLNLFTAILHTIGGQIDLIDPLLNSNLPGQVQTELLGVWHMVTIILFVTSFIFLYSGNRQKQNEKIELFSVIGYLYILFSLSFIAVSIFNNVLAMQWILLLPIGVIALIGVKQTKSR
jgi:hypothetical protein